MDRFANCAALPDLGGENGFHKGEEEFLLLRVFCIYFPTIKRFHSHNRIVVILCVVSSGGDPI